MMHQPGLTILDGLCAIGNQPDIQHSNGPWQSKQAQEQETQTVLCPVDLCRRAAWIIKMTGRHPKSVLDLSGLSRSLVRSCLIQVRKHRGLRASQMKNPDQDPKADCTGFAEIIDQVVVSVDSKDNVLTDEQFTCPYGEVPDAIEGIHQHFVHQDLSLEDCFAFECVNSVPGALALLCMLRWGYSFVLLPPLASRRGNPGSTELPAPGFCRYKVRVESFLGAEPEAWHPDPEAFLCIEENDRFSRQQGIEGDTRRKLYLRTSGSIGSPKMAVHSHAKLLGNVLNCVERFGLMCSDRIAIPVPIFHMYGLGAAFLPGIVVGASIDLQERSNILRYMERERRFDPNIAFLTPALCETRLRARRSPRSYKLTVTASDKIKKNTFLAFESRFGRLVNLYGSTEMGAIAASCPDDPLDSRAVTVGKPMSNVQVQLHAPGSEPTDRTDVSELYCRHGYGFAGYVDQRGDWIVQDKMAQSGWFRTGDLGRVRQDGHIEVLGRCDHSVNRSGLLVLFADIERAVETIEGVQRAIVVTKGESKWGQRTVAFCVLDKRAAGLDSAQIRNACFDVLPRHAIPDDVLTVSSLPTLPSGKVDRPALERMVSEHREDDSLDSGESAG